MADAEGFTVAGSIVANNIGNFGQAAPAPGPSNCGGAAKPTSNGSNVESLTDCNFTTTSDRAQHRSTARPRSRSTPAKRRPSRSR